MMFFWVSEALDGPVVPTRAIERAVWPALCGFDSSLAALDGRSTVLAASLLVLGVVQQAFIAFFS